jgi:peptidoglycan/LPS O-acetylase OafA/YrhL
LLFAAAIPVIFAATQNVKIDRWVGELSYPVYLLHGVILGVVVTQYGLSGTTLVLAVTVSLIGAIAVSLVVERPFARWHRIRAGRPATA